MLSIKNVSHFSTVAYYQAQIYGIDSIVYGVRDLLSGVSESENYILANHPVDGGKVGRAYWFQAVEEAGIKYIYQVTSVGTVIKKLLADSEIEMATEEFFAPAMVQKMFASFIHPVKVERIFANQENYHGQDREVGAIGITNAVLNLLKNPKVSETFRTTKDGEENYPEICITTIGSNKCFRWGRGDGSSSIIASGGERSMQPAFVAATIAANFYVHSNYRIWRLSQIEKDKNK